jgi:predicted TIM-barrel fold metal-dependent hydrolase
MRTHHVRALRLFPRDHRYFLDGLSWGDQLPVYAERRIPLFVKAGLDRVADLLRAFPSATVITDTLGANPLDRYAWPLLEAYPNLYYETSGYLTAGAIEAFCQRFGADRLVFSSGFPDYPSGAALLTLVGADISDDDRQAIARGNLARLLASVEL